MSLKSSAWVGVRIVMILTLLYFFICSLDLLSLSFRLLAGKSTGNLFSSDSFLANPVVGLMIGILGTVLVQSSSTFTSIIISMIGTVIPHDDIQVAVPMIMGSNIGTSVTNTIVSLTQAAKRDEFRRAFAAATVHDMFNWCTVLVMLPVEVITKAIFQTGFLYYICSSMAESAVGSDSGEVKILKYLTEPFTNLIVQIDSSLIGDWAIGKNENCTMVVRYCPEDDAGLSCWDKVGPHCKHMFATSNPNDFKDWVVGLIMLILSLVMLCGALLAMVKILNSLLKGAIAVAVQRVLNPVFKNKYANYFYGYVNILVGAFLTFIVQSSSVFTSTLTPLVGIGLINVETVYPLFLGSNIGTTTTAMLAALAKDPATLTDSLTIALVHLFFNVFGLLIFYPIPFMRVPISMCKILGDTTAKYRWFALLYLLVMFVLLPAFEMLTSLNLIAYLAINIPIFVALIVIVVINVLQAHERTKNALPKVLQSWDFLPKPLHSLGFYDRIVSGWKCCKKYQNLDVEEEDVDGEKVVVVEKEEVEHNNCMTPAHAEKAAEAAGDAEAGHSRSHNERRAAAAEEAGSRDNEAYRPDSY